MPFVLVVLLLAVGSSYARGGRLSRLGQAPLRRPAWLFAGVTLQVAVELAARGLIGDAGVPDWPVHVGGQVLVAAFVVANWQLPGTLLIALGLACNAAAIAANGAMPVEPSALGVLGARGAELTSGVHTLVHDGTRLRWLADRWPLPVLRSVISPGDVILAAGVIPVTHALMSHRSPAERRGRPTPGATGR